METSSKRALRISSALSAAAFAAVIISIPSISLAANTHSLTTSVANAQYLTLPDAGATSVDVTSDFTIEAWVKLHELPSTAFTIVSKWNEVDTDRNYSLTYVVVDNTQKYIELGINDTGEAGRGNNLNVLYTLPIGTWQHIAVTYSTTDRTARFYVNGIFVGDESGNITSLTNGNAEFRIGSRHYDNLHLNGLVDEVRLWHEVRSQTQIAANRLTELTLPQANLGGYWKLNQNGTDASGNGNHMTSVNGPAFTTDKPFDDAPPPPPAVLEAIKGSPETRTATTMLPDGSLKLLLPGPGTYTVTGSLVFSPASFKNDVVIKLQGTGIASSTLNYLAQHKPLSWPFNTESKKINLDIKNPTTVALSGTVTVPTNGTMDLHWAPPKGMPQGTTLEATSFLKAVKQ